MPFASTRPQRFGGSPAGQFGGAFDLDKDGINAIGALLRTLSAMENIRYGNALAEQARRTGQQSAASQRIREVIAETDDAIEVLTRGPLKLYPDAVKDLREAVKLEQQALRTGSRTQRNALLGRAIRLKQDTSAMMIN